MAKASSSVATLTRRDADSDCRAMSARSSAASCAASSACTRSISPSSFDSSSTCESGVGVGYNFTEFSDDLTDFDYDHKGWFLNLVGTY